MIVDLSYRRQFHITIQDNFFVCIHGQQSIKDNRRIIYIYIYIYYLCNNYIIRMVFSCPGVGM
jgi:hypothetical protein